MGQAIKSPCDIKTVETARVSNARASRQLLRNERLEEKRFINKVVCQSYGLHSLECLNANRGYSQ